MLWDWNAWGGWGGMILMMAFMVVFWGGIIALVVWVIVRLTRRDQAGRPAERDKALDIARERYAKGDITREEYDRLKKDLS